MVVRMRPLIRALLVAGAVLAAVALALALFEPWKLVIDDRVDEPVPIAAPPAAPPATPSATAAPSPPAEPVVLARGALIGHEHESTGAVEVLGLPDGSRVLRLEDLDTSNGPDLRVWLTDAPVIEGRDGWHVFDDGRYVDLGGLQGNIGSSNYLLPPEADLAQLSSVSIWCERFAVSFAAAELTPG